MSQKYQKSEIEEGLRLCSTVLGKPGSWNLSYLVSVPCSRLVGLGSWPLLLVPVMVQMGAKLVILGGSLLLPGGLSYIS